MGRHKLPEGEAARRKKVQKAAYARRYRAEHLEQMRAYERSPERHAKQRVAESRPLARARRLVRAARRRAKILGREFTITYKDIVIPDRCPVLGTPLIEHGLVVNSPSIDRIDNTRGYVPGNVCVISFRANWVKNNATLEEISSVAKYLQSNTEPAYDWL